MYNEYIINKKESVVMLRREDLEKTIIYNCVESVVLGLLNEVSINVSFDDIIDKEDPIKEDLSNDTLLCFRFSIIRERFLEIRVEAERVIYLLLDEDNCEIEECVLNSEEFCDKIYC